MPKRTNPTTREVKTNRPASHSEDLLEEGLIETFPASDPVAITIETIHVGGAAAHFTPRSEVSPPSQGNRAMEARLEYSKASPQGITAFRNFNAYVESCGLERSLLELVKTRASQINGCAYCLDMHTKDARAAGETEQRLYALSAWREAPFYSGRERAALAWTEAVTQISERHIGDELYAELQKHFSEKEIVDLTLAVVAINGWNRLAIPFRTPPGAYKPRRADHREAPAS